MHDDIARPDLEEEELSAGQIIKRELSKVTFKSHNVMGFGHWTLYTLGHRQKHPELALAWVATGVGFACVGMPWATVGALLQAWLELGSDPSSAKLDMLRKKYDPNFEPLWILGDEPPGYMAKLEGAIDVPAQALPENPVDSTVQQSEAKPWIVGPQTRQYALPTTATPSNALDAATFARGAQSQAEDDNRGSGRTTRIVTALDRLLQAPLANRAFIGAQRTGKSGLVAVAGRKLAENGYTFYHINLASYSDGHSEDDDYTKHIHPDNSVRGDIAIAQSKEEVHRLVDRAKSLVHDWFVTKNSILIVDEWFSLASQTIDYASITYPLAQLIAGKLAHLTSAGTKRGLALWLITPQVKAGAMTEAGKEIKQCKLCYVGISPNKSIQWGNNRITWDAELFNYVNKNFPIDYPNGLAIQGKARICYVNGEWLPLGTTESHFEEMAKAVKKERNDSCSLSNQPESTGLFDDFLNEDWPDNPTLPTDRIDAAISDLKSKRGDRAQCLAELLEWVKDKFIEEGVEELKRGDFATSPWASRWKRKGTPFSKCSGLEYDRFLDAVVKSGFLLTDDNKTYLIDVS